MALRSEDYNHPYLYYSCIDCGKRYVVHITDAREHNRDRQFLQCPNLMCDGGNDPYDYDFPTQDVFLN